MNRLEGAALPEYFQLILGCLSKLFYEGVRQEFSLVLRRRRKQVAVKWRQTLLNGG
jgi:hypothetical protein